MKRRLNKEGKLLLILICMLLIAFLLMIAIITAYSLDKSDSQNNNLQNSIKQDIAHKNDENDVIKVIIDEQQKNNENKNEHEGGNVYNQNNNSVENPETNENNNSVDNLANENNAKKDKNTYYIKINNKENVVTIYKKDSKGKYTEPVKAMLCSIGDATPTSGVFRTSDMYTWRLLQGNVYGQYAVRITGHILFHSVPYKKQSKSSLEWWEYDKLGTDASLGCIRLTVEDAKWIYDNCPKGTQVEFYASSNPGPLGKPTVKKISSYNDDLKNWDPTDPDSKNPWKTYVEASNLPESNTVQTDTLPIDTNTISDDI